MRKIVFVGAGSVEFSQKLLVDILSFPELGDSTIVLQDISETRLQTAAAVAGWTVGALEVDARIETTSELRAALEGANYVITMFQVGGHGATLLDFEIPKRYGLRQTIGDTIGIGGIFRGLRSIPVILEVGRAMSELCPDAFLLNYTNPMAMMCWATSEGAGLRNVVGLCHSVEHTTRQLASYVGVPFDQIDFLVGGVNHQAFVLRFEAQGQDLYPVLDAAIENDPELRRKVRVEVYQRLGYFPTESSEHLAEYVPWFVGRPELIQRFRIPIDEYVRRSEANLRRFEEQEQQLFSLDALHLERSIEYASRIIHSLETGEPTTIYGNVRNDGLIDNLPEGACVEVPCVVDAEGLRPQAIGALPPQLAALNRTFLNVVELTVRAVLDGKPDYVRHAAMLDPNTAATLSLDEIWSLCDELIEAHGLDQFVKATKAGPSLPPHLWERVERSLEPSAVAE